MAADGEFFTIGSTVSCTTCFDQNIEGEVLAFDQNTKMLILSEYWMGLSVLPNQWMEDNMIMIHQNRQF